MTASPANGKSQAAEAQGTLKEQPQSTLFSTKEEGKKPESSEKAAPAGIFGKPGASSLFGKPADGSLF